MKKDYADEIWEVAWVYIKNVVDTAREPFLILNKELEVLSANRTFYSFFNTDIEKTEGKLVYDLGNGQWNVPKLKVLLEDILPKNTYFDDFKVEHTFPEIGRKIIILNARRLYGVEKEKEIIMLAMEDITKRVKLEEQLKVYAEKLASEVANKTKELEERILQLEETNKLMIGREIKMTELKEEIRKAKKKQK